MLSGNLSPIGQVSGGISAGGEVSGGLNVPPERPYELSPATTETLGGIIVGENLSITPTGVLSVLTADEVQHDNTLPITSAAVYTEVGNINALLATI